VFSVTGECLPCTDDVSCDILANGAPVAPISKVGLGVGISVGCLVFVVIVVYGRVHMNRRSYAKKQALRESLLYDGPSSGLTSRDLFL
jgi:hypothetical protein